MGRWLYEEDGFSIPGATFEVDRELGCGFLEAVDQECLEKESLLGFLIRFGSQPSVPIVRRVL